MTNPTWREMAAMYGERPAAPRLDVNALRLAIHIVSLRHDWEHTTDREDRAGEIAAEYTLLLGSHPDAF
jgi:hypothetical protein